MSHPELSVHAARHDADRCLKLETMRDDALEIAERVERSDTIAARHGVAEYALATTPEGHTTVAITRGGDGQAFLAEVMKDHEVTPVDIGARHRDPVEAFISAPDENELAKNVEPLFTEALGLDISDTLNTKTHFPEELRKVHG